MLVSGLVQYPSFVGEHPPLEGADTAHWLALEVALTTMENAGHTANTLPKETTGVIIGNSLTGEPR